MIPYIIIKSEHLKTMMKKINIRNDDLTTILTVTLMQLPNVNNINELFKTNVIDDLNHNFIYDEVLRYIIEKCFNPSNGFDKETLKLFYGNKNCWIIHNKLIELLQSSKDWWAQGGAFKMVLDLDTANQGYIIGYVYYEHMEEFDVKSEIRNITTLKFMLYDIPNKLSSISLTKEFVSTALTSLNILNKLISFSNCLGFYKWLDKKKKIVKTIDFNVIEEVIGKARDFVKSDTAHRFLHRKDYEIWAKETNELLDKTFKTFNDLENNILNYIDSKKEEMTKELTEQALAEKTNKKSEINDTELLNTDDNLSINTNNENTEFNIINNNLTDVQLLTADDQKSDMKQGSIETIETLQKKLDDEVKLNQDK